MCWVTSVHCWTAYQCFRLLAWCHMYCWLSALAMTCFADCQSSVLLSTWRQIFRWISYLSAPFSMKYISLIIGSRHDVFRWLSRLYAIVIMASDNSLIIRAVCSLFHEICLADYQPSPWHISLIITSLCYLPRCQIFCWLSELYAPFFMKHVLLIINSRRDMFRWLSQLCAALAMAWDNSLIIRALS
jgi:hypothetical protein